MTYEQERDSIFTKLKTGELELKDASVALTNLEAMRKTGLTPASAKAKPEPWEALSSESGELCDVAERLCERNPRSTVKDLEAEFDAGEWKKDVAAACEEMEDGDFTPWDEADLSEPSMEEALVHCKAHGDNCLLSTIRDMTLEQFLRHE